MEKENIEFKIGDIVKGCVSGSHFEVIQLGIENLLLLKIVKSNRNYHKIGKIIPNQQPSHNYSLVRYGKSIDNKNYEIW